MNVAAKTIDTVRFAANLRAQAIDVNARRLLISRISGSTQEADLTKPAQCNGYARVRHFSSATAEGWPLNPLPILPACRALGLTATDAMTALVFQNAACAWRCWYCFVPEELLKADPTRSAWFSADQLVELYRQVPDTPLIIDLSGGSPDLVPEWTVWMMKALLDVGLDRSTYLWTDDNLSTTYLFDVLGPSDRQLLRSYSNYGRVGCIKGFDPRSFTFNTRATPSDYFRQFDILARTIELGLDLYGYVTLTSPHEDGIDEGVSDLLDRLQAIDTFFPLRVVPLRIQVFAPVEQRVVGNGSRERSLEIQERAVAVWKSELIRRFDPHLRGLAICDTPRSVSVR